MTDLDVIDRFLTRAAAQPRSPAVVTSDGVCTYDELEDRVRRFAMRFRERSAPRVLVALSQSVDAYAAMLAAGLAGGFYTPVNVAAPERRLQSIARQLDPDIVVARPALLRTLAAAAPDALLVDPDGPALLRTLAAAAPDALLVDPDDIASRACFEGRGARHELAYVIFTSGSTGEPKGVMIARHALDHYIGWAVASLGIGSSDKVSQHPNIGFDLSVLDIYGALCSGAALYPIATEGDRLLPGRVIRRHELTVWISVPSVVGLMMRAGDVTKERLRSVRSFVFCGEPLLCEHLEAIFAACPGATVINSYGPTEATVAVTSLSLTRDNFRDACGRSVALGGPIPDMAIHLVGGTAKDEGEIVIAGPQLALGYWNDPERTAASFRTLTIGDHQLRGYHTGDWASIERNHLFFVERLDFQVKIRGYRIELDEVAASLREAGWPTVCVCKWRGGIAAVVEQCEGKMFDKSALLSRLAEKLDAYALPATLRVIPAMPRNANDKIDRDAVISWLEATSIEG